MSPSPCFPTGTPPSLIVRRYLSLLDTAVELELPGYQGPRLPQRQRVPIFPQPLITDRARCKYRWARGMAATGTQSRKARASVSSQKNSLEAVKGLCRVAVLSRHGPSLLPLSFPLSHKDIVAEGLRQLLGEEKYRQDLTVPPGYCTGEVWTVWVGS